MDEKHDDIIYKLLKLTQDEEIKWESLFTGFGSGIEYNTVVNKISFSLFCYEDNKTKHLIAYPDGYSYPIANNTENNKIHILLDDLYKAIKYFIDTEKVKLNKNLYEKTRKALFEKE